jgi:O-antigen ligase
MLAVVRAKSGAAEAGNNMSAVDKTAWVNKKNGMHTITKLPSLAILLYTISIVKFYVRDPLSTQTGPQGMIEVVLVMGAVLALLPALRALRYRPFIPPTAKAFVVFALLAALSSVFSFNPMLSLMKAMILLLVCGIAVTASSALTPVRVLRSLFLSLLLVLATGLLYKLASGDPWFDYDTYSRRFRLAMFGWHPNILAYLCALTLLTSLLLPRRPPYYLLVSLFILNILTASRASTALLVLVLLLWGIAAVGLTPRTVLIGSLGVLVIMVAWIGLQLHPSRSSGAESMVESLYGNQLGQEIGTLNGRTEVWDTAAPLLRRSLFLGFGIDGSRDVLITETKWAAPHAHNAILELILGGGIPAMLFVLFGWAGSAGRAWLSAPKLRLRILGIYGYVAVYGLTEANLLDIQFLPIFLIVTLDCLLYAAITSQNSAASLPQSTSFMQGREEFQ